MTRHVVDLVRGALIVACGSMLGAVLGWLGCDGMDVDL